MRDTPLELQDPSSITFDDKGKLNRRIWLLERRNDELIAALNDADRIKEDALGVERAVAQGLRDRISVLEDRSRNATAALDRCETKRLDLENELKSLNAQHINEENRFKVDLVNAKEVQHKLQQMLAQVQEINAPVKEENLDLSAEVKWLKETNIDQSLVLQPQSPKLKHPIRPSTPTTASKSPTKRHPSTSQFSPSTSLPNRYAYLNDRHTALKNEYDKLRNKYAEDLKHWKEYHALEKARVELKKLKKSERRNDRETAPDVLVGAPYESQSLERKPDDTIPVNHTLSIIRTTMSATRVAPLLGQPSPTRASASNPPQDSLFSQTPPPVEPHTSLIRDRGNPNSLRRSALTKTMSEVLEGKSSRPSPVKRKYVDMETMSLAEKSAELKRLSKMSASEKRGYYARYKGKGRYLAAEDLRPQVLDEFEIDPDQNEGATFQFHDVKRRKSARKQMHGGDCECCKDYYEALGPIPKFNEAPRWRDQSQVETRDAEMQEHQKKVSRHRETWRRAPTPPGFWDIGFPTTQVVHEQNAKADEMVAAQEAQIRREAAHKDSKWRNRA